MISGKIALVGIELDFVGKTSVASKWRLVLMVILGVLVKCLIK